MVQAPRRPALSGPTLVRLLAQLADADFAEPPQSLSDRLSQWLVWTDAIALSTALSGQPPTVATGTAGMAGARASGGDEAKNLCTSVRSALTKVIAREHAPAPAQRGVRAAAHVAPVDESADQANQVDYREYRQRHLAIQQTLETEIGQLRGRLRAMLAATTPALARLAAVDAIMERSLGTRERSLLASVPALLGAHFERLRAAQAAGEPEAVARGVWLDRFCKDRQSVLLAELEVRFQPVEGLLAALRAR
ncbi:DUF3348 domain-containing protein [Paraburkholderia denitrificans]|uniref:DUF3348 domain-containing protein n=1 Tax=Paraburkholderia denitrificans TaxID=694025 RepID=A0ABW0JA24_9BURK